MTARRIAITGATGFVGRHLLRSLAGESGLQMHALSYRRSPQTVPEATGATWIPGDLESRSALDALLEGTDTLVHLAYPAGWPVSRHEACIRMLADAADRSRVGRVIHCSSAVVVGPDAVSPVDEATPARPLSDYERGKLRLETLWRDASLASAGQFDLAILRPTAVFGPGGLNLLRLAQALWSGSSLANYLRASVSGSRRMNLVYIDNVVSALRFLIARDEPCAGSVFIVSDDDAPENNYRDVERLLRAAFGRRPRGLPPLPVPAAVLNASLRLRGRARSDRIYAGRRLAESGWRRPVSFSDGVLAFARWFVANRSPA